MLVIAGGIILGVFGLFAIVVLINTARVICGKRSW